MAPVTSMLCGAYKNKNYQRKSWRDSTMVIMLALHVVNPGSILVPIWFPEHNQQQLLSTDPEVRPEHSQVWYKN